MAFKAVIFDLDGTLADTLEDIADTLNRSLAANGFPTHHYDACRFFVGNGLENLVAKSLPEAARTEAVIHACHAQVVADYAQHYINKTRLYDGIPALLDGLSQAGFKMAVLSNKADAITQKICGDLLQRWHFEIILGAGDRFPRKPDPQAALFLAEEMKATPAEVLYLGDSDVDMHTAIAAGFYPVGAGWGFRPVEELLNSGARKIIQHPTELLGYHSITN
ncbi:MAG: HAD family hydrolase [Bacteroidales bacterium]|jgi:phosphoglycolate phosphatase|nr:HAD family hydrolase [Bacteroidales bacterium]